jgi:hypothetical protein
VAPADKDLSKEGFGRCETAPGLSRAEKSPELVETDPRAAAAMTALAAQANSAPEAETIAFIVLFVYYFHRLMQRQTSA